MVNSYSNGKRYVTIEKGDEIYNDDGIFIVGYHKGSGLVFGSQCNWTFADDDDTEGAIDYDHPEERLLTFTEIAEMIYRQNPYASDRPYRVSFYDPDNETED